MDGASPQLENGFTKIANELLEAVIEFKCPPSVTRTFLAVLRETYGWNEKTKPISRQRIADLLGVSYDRARQCIKEANSWGMIICYKRAIGPQKDYTKWGKPETRTTGFGRNRFDENREGSLPVKSEGQPSAKSGGQPSDSDPPMKEAHREGSLPVKSEGRPSAHNSKERKDKNVNDVGGGAVVASGHPDGDAPPDTIDVPPEGPSAALWWMGRLYGFEPDEAPQAWIDWTLSMHDRPHLIQKAAIATYEWVIYKREKRKPPTTQAAMAYMRTRHESFARTEDEMGGANSGMGRKAWTGWPDGDADTLLRMKGTPELIDALAMSPDYKLFKNEMRKHFNGIVVEDVKRRYRELYPGVVG